MAKEKYFEIKGFDATATKDDVEKAVLEFLFKAAPDGLGIDKAKIDKLEAWTDKKNGNKVRGDGSFEAADDIAATVDVADRDTKSPVLGKITIKDRKPKRTPAPTPTPTPPAATPPAAPTPATTPPPTTPATPAAPARRTATPRTTATRATATRASGTKVWLIIVLGLLALAVIAAAIVLPLTLGGGDPEAREMAHKALTGLETLQKDLPSQMADAVKAGTADLREQIGRLERDNHMDVPPTPAPAPVPPAPVAPPASAPDRIGHHPVDDGGHYGARSGGRTRNDEQDARIAALEARATANERHDAEQDRLLAEQARIQQVLVEWNGTDACRRGDARSRQGCQYLEAQLGRQFE